MHAPCSIRKTGDGLPLACIREFKQLPVDMRKLVVEQEFKLRAF